MTSTNVLAPISIIDGYKIEIHSTLWHSEIELFMTLMRPGSSRGLFSTLLKFTFLPSLPSQNPNSKLFIDLLDWKECARKNEIAIESRIFWRPKPLRTLTFSYQITVKQCFHLWKSKTKDEVSSIKLFNKFICFFPRQTCFQYLLYHTKPLFYLLLKLDIKY